MLFWIQLHCKVDIISYDQPGHYYALACCKGINSYMHYFFGHSSRGTNEYQKPSWQHFHDSLDTIDDVHLYIANEDNFFHFALFPNEYVTTKKTSLLRKEVLKILSFTFAKTWATVKSAYILHSTNLILWDYNGCIVVSWEVLSKTFKLTEIIWISINTLKLFCISLLRSWINMNKGEKSE